MTQASQKIMQQYIDGGVIPAHLVGQDAVSKTYVDGQLALRDANINAAMGAAGAAQADIDAHESSTTAHPSQNITYSGKAVGNNVKAAIDGMDSRIDNLILESGNSDPEVADARGGYAVLGERLNASDEILRETVKKGDFVFNVKDYGAEGDGGTNDSTSIQALINTVGSNGRGTIVVPPGDYILNTGLDFAPFASASGKPCGFVMMKGAKFIAAQTMDYMINLQSNEIAQIQNGLFVFDHLDGQSFATFLIRMRGVSDCRIECGILQNGVSGFVSDMSGIPNYGNFNNNITIYKITGCSTNGFYAIGNMGDPHTDFQGNLVNIRQVIHCGNNGVQLNDNTVNRSWYNTFDIGALEENSGYGIYVNSGRNIIRVNSTNNNGVKGLGGPSSVERCNISGYFEDGMDQSLTEKNNINVQYPIMKNGGRVSVVNGSNIPHTLAFTPTKVKLTSMQSAHIVSVFAVNENTITVGLYNHDGTAITATPEDVWWEAEV